MVSVPFFCDGYSHFCCQCRERDGYSPANTLTFKGFRFEVKSKVFAIALMARNCVGALSGNPLNQLVYEKTFQTASEIAWQWTKTLLR